MEVNVHLDSVKPEVKQSHLGVLVFTLPLCGGVMIGVFAAAVLGLLLLYNAQLHTVFGITLLVLAFGWPCCVGFCYVAYFAALKSDSTEAELKLQALTETLAAMIENQDEICAQIKAEMAEKQKAEDLEPPAESTTTDACR